MKQPLKTLIILSLISCGLMNLSRAADTSTSLIDKISGRYSHKDKMSNIQNEEYDVEDTLEIIPLEKDIIYFSTLLNFYNGHECSLEGIAKYQKNGSFLFFDKFGVEEGKPCTLSLILTSKGITLKDNLSCKNYCGARGSFDGKKFEASSRKPISNLTQKAASAEVQDKLKIWKLHQSK